MGTIGIPPLNVGSGLVSVTIGADSYFSDPDGDTLTYTASSSDTSVVTFQWFDTSLSVESVGGGTATVTITASDGSLTATQSVSVTVTDQSTPTNRTPVTVGSIPGQTVTVGGNSVTVDVSSYFSDPDGDALTYIAYSSHTTKATVSASGAMVTITPVAAGTSTISLVASDPAGLDAIQYFSVTVSGQSTPTNNAPTAVGSIPGQTVNASGSTSIGADSYFSDPDGDALTYTASSSDTGVATASTSGVTVTITAVAAGTTTITVTASDPGGLTATQTFTVTVYGQSNPCTDSSRYNSGANGERQRERHHN